MKNIRTEAKMLLTFLSVIVLCSCSKDQPALHATEVVLDDNLLRSSTRYEANLNARGDGDDHSFIIQSVTRTQNTLSVVVKGGCTADAFTFVWDGRVAESYPMQTWILLTHEESGASCGTETIHELDLDLSKLQLSQADLDNCVVHVGNGSMKQDLSIDPDGVVSHH